MGEVGMNPVGFCGFSLCLPFKIKRVFGCAFHDKVFDYRIRSYNSCIVHLQSTGLVRSRSFLVQFA